MELQACADLVAKGDPDRFAAAMAAPVEARRVLFPLYAFNLEVARAPWVVSEPMIGEMRLQWWRDALAEIAAGEPVRRHEVATPLGEVLTPALAEGLDALVAARRWDLYREPFADEAALLGYLDATGATLSWTAAAALGAGAGAEDRVRAFGRGAALARYFVAVPELEARGRVPLVDGRPEAVAGLARQTLVAMPARATLKRALPPLARSALIEAWQARGVLARAARDPSRVVEGRLAPSEFRRRLGLLLASR